ncbi:ion transporter [Methanospirillum hungatei]|uniref:ion transporter n=1 Tax=Methanospirillum hungatei TaxID=2203 RepID=UPI0003255613|nr:ion transporter [Methanospirillum hungatei]
MGRADIIQEYPRVYVKVNSIKTRIHYILDTPAWHDRTAVVIHGILATVILANAIAIILSTVRPIAEHHGDILTIIMNICMAVFVCEYGLRMWACTDTHNPVRMITDRVRYAFHLYLIIDLISILPIFIPFFFPQAIMIIRLFRLSSIFKLGRFTRYSESIVQLRRVIVRKKEIFAIMLFFLVFIILFSSTIMYVVEYPAQPDAFSSIPAALWWAVMTVTTVGYGDIIPVTPLGKLIAGFVTMTGVLVLALPSAIMATGFIEERERQKNVELKRKSQGIPPVLAWKLDELKEKGYITQEEYILFWYQLSGDEKKG